MMLFRRLAHCTWLLSLVAAYQPNHVPQSCCTPTKKPQNPLAARVSTAAATAFLSLALLGGPAVASDTAAQIALERLPPTSISIEIGDLPVIGKLVSGTYSKVPDGSIAQPSIVIRSPKDKVKAIQSAATGGHLEFDVGGKLSTHLDVDIAADQPGKAKVLVESSLIPKLPFKNRASETISGPTGGKESQWNIVTNLGSGESYYYNLKTGVTQYDRPDKI